MWKSIIILFGLVLAASALTTLRANFSTDHPKSQNDRAILDPVEWTMSKANLVAEFFTSEPAPNHNPFSQNGERSPKSLFSFFGGKNESTGAHNVKRSNSDKNRQRLETQQALPGNFIPVEANFNGFPPPNNIGPNSFRFPTNNGGGYATPFRPLIKFPPQSSLSDSGYPQNLRPPRGPPPLPPAQPQLYLPPNRPNGLRPPPTPPQPQRPQNVYLPPQNQPQHPNQNQRPSQLPPQPIQKPSANLALPYQEPRPPQVSPPPLQLQQQQTQYLPPAPPPPPPQNNSFTSHQQYLPQKPEQFRPNSPSPQILDTYRNQAVYPVPASPQQPDKQLVYVMANSSDTSTFPPTLPPRNIPDPYTHYENEAVPPSSLPQPLPPQASHYPQGPPPPPPQQSRTAPPHLNINDLALTEPLSQVLAEANSKEGDMDKTIRFVIHKPEDEDIVRNAILEDAQNRYEDVRFIQGPTLKVQRKETVYLPPKKKTVVYILLKEPQIDTDVEVMSPQEDDPAPEVYITYQKSDGAVKTKHYSPKPMLPNDMKKYMDIEEDSHYGEESRIHPRFSKSTSVSLSTSSQRRTASSSSSSLYPTEVIHNKHNFTFTSPYLLNHRMSYNDSSVEESRPPLKPSPLLYSTFTSSSGSISTNNNSLSNDRDSLINYRAKKGRSTPSLSHKRPTFVQAGPRRVLRNPKVHCPPGSGT